ncbi:MAG TPA: potassium/proton antiporter [Gaiellales bacterium]|nr:potassium/proton antiporter [Gaiellales bacterium]
MLVAGGLVFAAVLAAYATTRLNIPILIGFLGLGMLLGSDGPGGIAFSDAHLARVVGVLCLAAILFEGGLTTDRRHVREVALPALSLGTLGVLITAGVCALAARSIFGLSTSSALLLGAVVGSTDAAAVFTTLRRVGLPDRLSALLEAESGVNDPMAVALTLGFISVIQNPDYGAADFTLLLIRQFGIGAAVGLAAGALARALFARMPPELATFAPVLALACGAVGFGIAGVAGGSGFLAVYLVGLALFDMPAGLRRPVASFNAGVAFLAQIVLFVVLGLLEFPHQLAGVVVSGLGLAAVLTLIARPLAVAVSTAFMGFTGRERVFLGWAGLRGGVPIVLATFPLSEGLHESTTIFNTVFFVVLVSVLVQGMTLGRLATALGIATPPDPVESPPIAPEVIEPLGAQVLTHVVGPGDAVDGRSLRDLELPTGVTVSLVIRGDEAVPPDGGTRLRAGDRVYLLTRSEGADALRRVLGSWSAASASVDER